MDELRARHVRSDLHEACGYCLFEWPCDFIRADDERRRLLAVVEAARSVVTAWVDDESGMETFDPECIDRLGDALAALDEVKP